MSFWKKLFGRSFEETVAAGEELLESGQPGEARLEFEQALSRAKGEPEARIEHVRAKIVEARRQVFAGYVEQGKAFAREGQLEHATECFESARDVAVDDAQREEVQQLVDGLEAQDARDAYDETETMTEAERFQVLSGAWEDERADELELYGERFRSAFLELHSGKAEEAAAVMAELLEENEDAVYLHLELGLAVRHAGRLVEAAKHLKSFLSIIKELEAEGRDEDEEDEDEEEGDEDGPELVTPEAQVQAHVTLAEIYLELDAARKARREAAAEAAATDGPAPAPSTPGDDDDHDYDYEKAAEKELRTLIDLLPEQSSPYVHLGSFLRRAGRLEEALEVLEDGRPHLGEIRPDMRLVRELGLTQRALGDAKAATASLQAVVEYSAMLDDYNFDPTAAEPLAELYEEQGDLERATDLYRHLAAGTNRAGHYAYNFAAGRLLLATKKLDLSRKYLARAQELAASDEDRAAVEELLAKLES